MRNLALIQQKFERSSLSYNKNAIAQREIADDLYRKICLCVRGRSLNKILEIGCGTGFLTQSVIALNPSVYYLNDINQHVEDLLQPILKESIYQVLLGDAEKQEFPYQLDLVISSSCFQWFRNLPFFLTQIGRHIKPSGFLIFSCFGPDNLKEIKAISGTGLFYPSLGEIIENLPSSYELVFAEEKHIKLKFDTPYEVLKHLKYTGVNGGFSTVWTKSKFKDFCESYTKKFTQNNQVVLTYHPLYIGIKKR